MKPPRKKVSSAANELAEFEWNFHSVPDNELVACCYWEYARESAFIRDVRRRYSDSELDEHHGEKAWRFVGQDAERIESIGYEAEVFMRGFSYDEWRRNYPPLTRSFPAPWQCLEPEERKERARIRNEIEVLQLRPIKHDGTETTAEGLLVRAKGIVQEYRAACDKAHRENPGVSEHVLRQKGIYPSYVPSASGLWEDGTESTIVSIDWRHFTNDEIANEFRKWIRDARPKQVHVPSGQGRKLISHRVNLERLGILRLLHRYSLIHLRKRLPAAWNLYKATNRRWLRDAEKACACFHELFPFLPKKELPLSWPPKT